MRKTTGPSSPTLATRVLAAVRCKALDRQLADGADPADSPALNVRAAQLTQPPVRERIATALERWATASTGTPRRFEARPPDAAIARNQHELRELAALLRGRAPLYVSGIARLRLVIVNGTGLAYTDPTGEGLARELKQARQALLQDHPSIPVLAVCGVSAEPAA